MLGFRAGALRHVHHRIDVRPADLPSAAAGRNYRRNQSLVARERRSGARERHAGLQPRQSAAHPQTRRPRNRTDRLPRRGRAVQRDLPRNQRRITAHSHGDKRARTKNSSSARSCSRRHRQQAALAPAVRRPFQDAFASGWMQVHGDHQRRGVDQGFALSDHADSPVSSRRSRRPARRAHSSPMAA